ncbi:hypothetical protein [Vandammella animalimorsus]|uniref:Uncharacterized protein n=1 Tax=Vandammella animalimorsus TaxID=2029117 RepID=A0A2A2AH54_9BURK|nr:hypothetical protein [Vandammella animalimorsus]PAT37042.1 hypothetical protein CK625_07725 [Vandammella animalimorsus]
MNHRHHRIALGACAAAAAMLTMASGSWAQSGHPQQAQKQEQKMPAQQAQPQHGNRIEVTGNRAERIQVHCDANAAVNVNSVNIQGRALRGETVVVTGRNTQDVRIVGDCAEAQDGATGQRTGPVQINSVTIR